MKQGNYADGGGLYLQVTKSGAKSWIYKFMLNGRAREMGLGPLHTVSLSAARDDGAERWSDMPAPLIGSLPVQEVDVALIMKVLEPSGWPNRKPQAGFGSV